MILNLVHIFRKIDVDRMAGKFNLTKFSNIDLSDPFFDSLKADYPLDENNIGFEAWFNKKSKEGATALVFSDESGLGAFICLKDENESIQLKESTLPAVPRKKISTLLIAERYRGQRLGEGAVGLALWNWQKSNQEEIYVTVFKKHEQLISQLEMFGFRCVGQNLNGEEVYLKSRKDLDYNTPYASFPFINPRFEKAGYLIVDDIYHDTLFPYSELKGTFQEHLALSVANGICKIYVGNQFSKPHYRIGEPVFIYRKYTTEDGQKKKYKSCLTSFCIVTNIIEVKHYNKFLMSFEELIKKIGNKSVFDEDELRSKYQKDEHLMIIEMLYYGYFGEGNNVNMAWLLDNGYWSSPNVYPTNIQLKPDQFKKILEKGNIDVSNVIVDISGTRD